MNFIGLGINSLTYETMGPSVDGGVCVCVGRGGGEAPSIQIPIRPTKVG